MASPLEDKKKMDFVISLAKDRAEVALKEAKEKEKAQRKDAQAKKAKENTRNKRNS